MAYLTSTDEVVNTFTVGKVSITLDETDVDANGVKDGETRVKANSYKLIPGRSYIKDPVIHIAANSEDCWLFVQVADDIAAIEDAKTVAEQLADNGWTALNGADGIYTRARQATNTSVQDVKVMDSFTIKGTVSNEALAAYDGKAITVTAYAVQADGFDTALDAWNATFGAM